ncbi:Chitin synthase, class 2 [Irineochytrium annulatum]|nr:Chitin synthase, class 2 [Irineochytrium annulatum]
MTEVPTTAAFNPSNGYATFNVAPASSPYPLPPPLSQQQINQYQQQSYAAPATPVAPQPTPSRSQRAPANMSPSEASSMHSDTTMEHVDVAVVDDRRPSGPLKRAATMVRKVELDQGNLVIEVPVASALLEGVPFKEEREFTHMRYSAATCRPEEFASKFELRAKTLGREIRLAVVVTMYNEDDVLFAKSFTAIMKNIAYLCSGRCAGWDRDGWKHIVVCVVSDGRSKVNPLTLRVLGLMGCYADGLAKASVNNEAVQAHVYEYTNQVTVRRDLSIRRPKDEARDGLELVPCQTIFLLKERNAKKINSHRWFFKAVCDQLDPEVCLLVDVGTKPTKESFFHLYQAFRRDPNVAGACGEIAVELGKSMSKLLNPIVAVQNFEYKMSNILDKPLESVFGYISVLPGAFSAYRFKALQGEPLDCYFKGEHLEEYSPNDVRQANMYLAEDRILCFELVVKSGSSNILKYVKSARAETDVPDSLHDLIKQRRRWLNGSFFASVHATMNFKRIFGSGHSNVMKWTLMVEFIYNAVNLAFSWFSIGNFFLSFYFLFNISSDQSGANCAMGVTDSTADPFYPRGEVVFDLLKSVYVFSIVIMFIAALGNRPEGSKVLYHSLAILFAIIMFLMIFMGAWTVGISIKAYNESADNSVKGFFDYAKKTPTFRDMVISTLSTYGLYFLSSLLYMDCWHVFTCLLQYLFMVPSFINIFMVYAFCNLHDVSWGTKGIDKADPLVHVVAKQDKSGKQVVAVEVPADGQGADAEWARLQNELKDAKSGLAARKETNSTDGQTLHDDFYKQFRTNTLMLWLVTNGVLCYVFTSPSIVRAMFPNTASKQSVNPYLTFLFWSVAVISLIRFLASCVYLVGWYAESAEDAGKRNPFKKAAYRFKEAASDHPA